jgi:hypothetical protein
VVYIVKKSSSAGFYERAGVGDLMKKDTLLKLGLMLLGLFLALGPLLISLGTHNWNIMAAVMPSDAEIQQTTDMVTGLFDTNAVSENMFSIGIPTIQGSTIQIPAQFNSPFNIPITIKELTASVSDQGVTIAQVQTAGAVEIPARGSANITLVGTYTGAVPTDPQFVGGNITFGFYGIDVQVQMSVGQEG